MIQHSRRTKKRGAIELSMNTIIIVVIGITILTLGLRWIYSVFGGLTEQSDQIKTISEDQIREIFRDSGEPINIPTSIASVAQGKNYNMRVLMRNIYPAAHKFRYVVDAESTIPPGSVTWSKGDIPLSSGQGFEDIITFDARKYALGTYRFRVKLTCLDCTPPEEDSAPIVLEVTTK